MNVLVTGGTGFLGAYVVASLESRGHTAYAYDLREPDAETRYISPQLASRFRLGGINDAARLLEVCQADQISAIVHTAGRLGLELSLADPQGFYTTNVMGFVNVCEVARKEKMTKLVAISSGAVYQKPKAAGHYESDSPFSVQHASPAAHYGVSKMAVEAIGMVYAEFHGVDFTALRVPPVYGFGMRSPLLIKPMVENAVRGLPTRLPLGGPMNREYTHVLDCSEAAALAIDTPQRTVGEQRVFNIASGEMRTGAEIAQLVRRLVPNADIVIGDQLSPLDEANVKVRAPMDCTMALRLLKWSPRWTVEAGTREYIQQLRNYLN